MAAEVVGPGESELVRQLDRAGTRIGEIRTHLERAERAIARPINGQDGEGAVEIVLGGSGEVAAVRLDPDWRELLGERNLPEAVTEAYRAAHGSRLSDWSGALRESLGARGLLPLRSRALVAEAAGPTDPGATGSARPGLDPDLRDIRTDRPDGDVAGDLLAALNAAAAAPSRTQDARQQAAPGGSRTLRTRISDAFTCLGTAISTAPCWLDVTLVVAGAQKVLDTLRDVTEGLLDTTPAADAEPSAAGATGPWEHFGHGLESAAAQARTLLGIPEGLGLAAAAAAELVTAVRAPRAAGAEHHDARGA